MAVALFLLSPRLFVAFISSVPAEVWARNLTLSRLRN